MPTWIELNGLVNARDVGGIALADGGRVAHGRLLRSDNLQDLTPEDVAELRRLGLTDVIDLRSNFEVEAEGPGPLRAETGIRHHHFSFFTEPEGGLDEDGAELPDGSEDRAAEPAAVAAGGVGEGLNGDALPWVDLRPSVEVEDFQASTYLSFLNDRPDSVIASLRAIAAAPGAALVHCAAGKDRTGTTVALALTLVGAERAAVIADYAASNERMQLIVERLMASETYRPNLEGRPLSSHATLPHTMDAFLSHAEAVHGSVQAMLEPLGWTGADTDLLKRKLLS